jgi:mono/diheme cytochrome c family protein
VSVVRPLWLACLGCLLTLALGGCEKGIHDMYEQPRYDPLAASGFWPDGAASREPVAGTVISARGGFAVSSSGRVGYARAQRWDRDRYATVNPYPVTAALLARGRERFDVDCAPCHGLTGDGHGFIVQRGYPAPPSYHTSTLRNATDRHFVDVITYGYGLMYAYADRVSPADRWAIVAYIRALQLSQHAPVDALSSADRVQLGRAAAAATRALPAASQAPRPRESQ